MSDRETLEQYLFAIEGTGDMAPKVESAIRAVLEENERLREDKASALMDASYQMRRAKQAEARIDAALALHQMDKHGNCIECSEQSLVKHPCPTVKALRGEE